ncbi:uncharacterized protein AKAME5_002621600 [Lates japonicus]|uniref:C-type lectin domain-containing protein n=1 Tax=Lates japonicus TaxID=270547 RepID=A0AAD3NPU3_LATJO|nr:uncharacterized protein AKAME5_002621600 [Lates japonicus]
MGNKSSPELTLSFLLITALCLEAVHIRKISGTAQRALEELKSICYYDNLVVVNENKTWEEALSYCRDMTTSDFNYDILSPHYSDYSYLRERIYSRATTDEVWIGLRFLGGEWYRRERSLPPGDAAGVSVSVEPLWDPVQT